MAIDKEAIGIEVSWSFGFGDAEAVMLPRTQVRQALSANGFERGLIEDIDHNSALRKALHLVKGRSKTIVVQELRRPNKDTPFAIGVYMVHGLQGEAGDHIICGARARVQTQEGKVVALAPEGAVEIPECMVVAHELARIANSLVDHVVNRDLSDALTTIGWANYWISRRRNSGGVYFFPAGGSAERFVSLLQDLQQLTESSARAYQFIPQIMEVYPKPLTMGMWSASARDQYDAQVSEMSAQLKKISGTTRESTVERRAEECDMLIKQAEGHRLFLQSHVDTLATELRRLKGEFSKRLDEIRQAAEREFQGVMDATKPVEAPKAPPAAAKPATGLQTPPKRMRKPELKPLAQMTDSELFEE